MSEVKRYIVATLPGRMTRDCVEVVKARDYDALKTENARLAAALREVKATIESQTELVVTYWEWCERYHHLCYIIKTIDAALSPREQLK